MHIRKRVDTYVAQNYKRIIEFFLLGLLFFAIFYALDSTEYFKDTTPYGGDHTFHVSNLKTYREDILSGGRLSGWISNVYGGMAFPTFYPPFIFLLTAFLSIFIPSTIAYKLMIVIGLLGFPVAVYIAMRLFKFKWPTTPLVLMSLFAFIFHKAHFSFGGNLLSVLSGEIAYLYGLIFFILFAGFFYRGLKHHTYQKTCAFLLFLICISHPLPFVVACFGFFFVFLRSNLKKDILHVLRIAIPGLLLSASWLIGYFAYGLYSNMSVGGFHYEYGWPIVSIFTLFPSRLMPFVLLSMLFGLFALVRFSSFKKHDSPLIFCAFLLCIPAVLFLMKITNSIRLLPLVYLMMIIVSCGFISSFSFSKKYAVTKYIRTQFPLFLLIFSLALLVLAQADGLVQKQSGADWVIGGYEKFISPSSSKAMANQYADDMNVEGSRVDSYASDMFFVRAFTQSNSFTGLFHHTFSAPLIALFQTKLTTGPASNSAEIYSLYNVGWIVAENNSAITKVISNTSEFELNYSVGDQRVFKNMRNTGNYVEHLTSDIESTPHFRKWLIGVVNWTKVYNGSNTFLVYGDISPFVTSNKTCVVNETITAHTISFNTTCPNEPHLIKISYFPRWKSQNGEEIYVISPSFMLIYPETKNVKILFANTFVEYLSSFCFLLGVLCFIFARRIYKWASFIWNILFTWKPIRFIVRIHRKVTPVLVYLICISTLVLLLMIVNIELEVGNRLTEKANFNAGMQAYEEGDNSTAKEKLTSVKFNRHFKEKSFYVLGKIYLSESNLNLAKWNIYAYINLRGERSDELRYLLLTYYRENDHMSEYMHEMKLIQTVNPRSPWTKRAILDFREWKLTQKVS